MYIEGLYKVAQDAWDTLNKIIPVTDMLLCVQHLSVEQEFAKDDFDYALNEIENAANRVFDSTTHKCTIAGTSLRDSFILSVDQDIEEEESYGHHYVYLKSGSRDILEMMKEWVWNDEKQDWDYSYSKNVNAALRSVQGVELKLRDVISSLDDSIDFQNFLANASEMAQNGSMSIQQILTKMGSNSLGDLTQSVRDIIGDISGSFDLGDKIPSGTWLSIFSGIYQRLASAHVDQSGDIAFNDTNYQPQIAWRTIINTAVQVVSTIITVVGTPIIRVAAFLVSGAFSVISSIADAQVTTNVNAESGDILFAQPIGQRFVSLGTTNMPFTTYARQQRLVTSFTPYWARMTWSNNGDDVYQEVYARCLPLPVIQTLCDSSHLNLMDLTNTAYGHNTGWYSTMSPGIISNIGLKNAAEMYHDAFDDVDIIEWYVHASENDRRKATMLSVVLAFFLCNYESNAAQHIQSTSLNGDYDFSRNIYAMMTFVNAGCSWDSFYSQVFNPWIKPNIVQCCYDLPDSPTSVVVCMDECDSDVGACTIAQGVMVDRKHPFIAPPNFSLMSIVFGTIITAVVTAAALATASVVKKAVVRRNQSIARLRRKQLEDAKAEADQWALLASQDGLSKEEKAQYMAEWRRVDKLYSKQVRRFNLWAGFHGMAKVDAVTTYDLATDSSAAAGSTGSGVSSLVRDTYSQALEAEATSTDNLKAIKEKLQIVSHPY